MTILLHFSTRPATSETYIPCPKTRPAIHHDFKLRVSTGDISSDLDIGDESAKLISDLANEKRFTTQ